MVLGLDEEGQRDVAILDFFPFLELVTRHISNPSDRTIRHKKMLEYSRKNRAYEWMK